jgi:Spy/CpxP family protein refolding chaperone
MRKEVKKMKKTVVALGLAAIMLFGAAYVYAQGPGSGPGHPGMHFRGYENEFPLTPEQKAKFQELRRKFREDNAKLIGEIVTKRLELRSLWSDPKADSKAILDKEKELRGLQDQMRDKMVQMRLEARKFLTPEQIANWKPGWGMERGQMMAGRSHMRGHGRGMGCFGTGTGMWQ